MRFETTKTGDVVEHKFTKKEEIIIRQMVALASYRRIMLKNLDEKERKDLKNRINQMGYDNFNEDVREAVMTIIDVI